MNCYCNQCIAREYADRLEDVNGLVGVIDWNKNFFKKLGELNKTEKQCS